MAFVRTVKTGSGATAVQIVYSRRGSSRQIEHIGSAHEEAGVAALKAAAAERLAQGQGQLALGLAAESGGAPLPITSTKMTVLWDTLELVFSEVFGPVIEGDNVFRDLVLARIIEPTSKLDSQRVLEEVGVEVPSYATIKRRLQVYAEPRWRQLLAAACAAHTGLGPATLVLYDVTTLYFETDRADGFREPGYSKERRLEPQIAVGMLTDGTGFPGPEQWPQARVDSEFYAIVSDLAGAPTELIDPDTGNVAGRASRSLWGVTAWQGAGTPHVFTGQQHDPETGLHYNRFRYYNPVTSAFVSTDPLGIGPNPANANAYVHNPLTWVDPLGLIHKPTKGIERIYSSRALSGMANEPGPYHNFPGSFDEEIFSRGTRTVKEDFFVTEKANLGRNSIQYRLDGELNGRSGVYEIFTRPSTSGRSELIMHRFFRPSRS